MLLKAAQWCKIVLNSYFHVLDLISIGVLFKRTAWNSKIRLLRRLSQENHYQTFFLGHPVYIIWVKNKWWEQRKSNSTIAINQTSEKAISVLCGRSKKFRFVFESGEGSQKWNVQCISTFNLVSRVSNFLSHWKNLEQIGALDGIPRPSSQHLERLTL